jgi:hypothetical protein
MAAFAAVS